MAHVTVDNNGVDVSHHLAPSFTSSCYFEPDNKVLHFEIVNLPGNAADCIRWSVNTFE